MTIQETLDNLNKNSAERGWTVLGERVPQSEEAPHKIAVMKEPIKSEEPVVLVLPGNGGDIVTCNGLLKRVHDFVKNSDRTKQARVCVAIYDYKEWYVGNLARMALIVEKRYPALWFLMKYITSHPWTRPNCEIANPMAIRDIYDSVVYPKIVDAKGKRLSTQQMLHNIRTLTIVGYCAGGHVAMKLEEIIKKEMAGYGYNHKEIKAALGQIPVVGYAMNAPSEKSDLKFFNFNSVSDDQEMDSTFKRYLYLTTRENEFDLMHFSENRSDNFYCQSLNEQTVWVCKKIDDYLKEQEELAKIELHEDHVESKEDSYRQHSFIGFVEKTGFSNGARQLQSIFKSIIEKSVENSVQNSKGSKYIPLPETLDLIGDNVDAYGKSDIVYMRENIKYQFFRGIASLENIAKIPFYINAGRHYKYGAKEY